MPKATSPLDFDGQINLDDPAVMPVLEDLQGNILRGHGRDHVHLLFLRFRDGATNVAAARAWLSDLGRRNITSARRQIAERRDFKRLAIGGGLFTNLLLTRAGYDALGVQPPPDGRFRGGMKASRAKLGDPKASEWDEGYAGEIHACVLLAHDDADELDRGAHTIVSQVQPFADLVAGERGNALRNALCESIEHFGYVDGRSQPLFTTEELAEEFADEPVPRKFDPAAPLRLVLVPDPNGKAGTSFGSYLVFRKLEQNVRAFKAGEQALATALGLKGADAERAGAMVVGRFEDGTPVVLQKTDGLARAVPNDFDYAADPGGSRCPFQAHIRKMNPRGETGAPNERDRRIARRGITYGNRCVQPKDDPAPEDLPEKGVGLLFMCFQSDIAQQFEFMQASWGNNDQFVQPNTGLDPIIGQGSSNVTPRWPTTWGKPAKKAAPFHGAVTMKGGEYFFAPSLSFLCGLDAAAVAPARAARVMNVVLDSRRSSAYSRYTYGADTGARLRVHREARVSGFPPTPNENLVYRGGRTIRALRYANVYVGGKAAWKASDMTHVDDGLRAATTDRRLNNVLRQYFDGQEVTARFLGSTVLAGAPPAHVTRGDLAQRIFALHKGGQLDTADFANTVFNFFLPRGTELTDDDETSAALAKTGRAPKRSRGGRIGHTAFRLSSREGLGGYHGSVDAGATRIYYAVGAYAQGSNGIVVLDAPWKNIVATFYHELCEARTDPDVEEANRGGGETLLGWVAASGREIGDFPIRENELLNGTLNDVFVEVPLADGSGTVPVQLMYSNAVEGPEGPIASPH
jgi:Dyp-type peroxidase family